ncbi:MAG: hypothetical protein AAGA30_05775, partial [Planctomycetota bacterium]
MPDRNFWLDLWSDNTKHCFDNVLFHLGHFREIQSSVRENIIALAIRYTREYRDVHFDFDLNPQKIMMTGHQPVLFHSGVWYKNFILSHLGKRLQAVPIHLIIDNDICRVPSIQVPTGTIKNPELKQILIDEESAPVPFEHRRIQDIYQFTSFTNRLEKAAGPWVKNPLVNKLWTYVIDAFENPQ